MPLKTIFQRLALTGVWSQQVALAAAALGLGFGLLPIAIFFIGATALGRYEGASLPRLYDSIFDGLMQGSIASWAVVLGPYALCLLFQVLRLWWRIGSPQPKRG